MLEHEYGKIPPYVKPVISTCRNVISFAGKAVWETVTFTFTVNGKQHAFPTQLIYPVDAKKVPFFMYLNFRPDIPDRYLPVEELIDNGFGIFSVCYNDVTKDNGDFTDGIAGLFEGEEREESASIEESSSSISDSIASNEENDSSSETWTDVHRPNK